MIRSPDLADRPSRAIALVSLLVAGLAISALLTCWGGHRAHAAQLAPNPAVNAIIVVPQPQAQPQPQPQPQVPTTAVPTTPNLPGGFANVPKPQTPPVGKPTGPANNPQGATTPRPPRGQGGQEATGDPADDGETTGHDRDRRPATSPLPAVTPDADDGGSRLVLLVPIDDGPDIAAEYDLQVVQLASLQSLGQDMVLANAPAGLSALEAVSLIELDPRVSLVQLDLSYFLQDSLRDGGLAIRSPAAAVSPLLAARARGVLVGLIDSAVEVGHPAFEGADIETVDVVGTPMSEADAAHGTAMAGAILGGDKKSAAGSGARLLAIRAFSISGGGSARSATFAVAQAIDLAVVSRVDVLNLSFAGPSDPLVARLLATAAERGVLSIGAAGNAGPGAPPAYPAALPSVLAVTAIDGRDEVFVQANRGAYVGISAPGVDVIVAGPGGGYGISSGTSIAAAKVSGLAAAILGQSGGLAPRALEELLRRTAIDLGPRGPDEAYGAGKVDAAAARAAAQSLALKDG